jgi:hypothetical protein
MDMLRCVEQTPAPKRSALGSSTYHSIKAALSDRLATPEAFKEITLSTDVELLQDGTPAPGR